MKNTSLCYIEHQDCYLMLYRNKKKNDLNHGKWIGIGGKFEENESPEACARREILEETGLCVEQLCYRGIVTFVSDAWEGEYMHLFTSDQFSGTLTDCDEGTLAWVPKNLVSTLPIWEGDRIFLDLLLQTSSFFSLKLCYHGDVLYEAWLGEKQLSIPDTVNTPKIAGDAVFQQMTACADSGNQNQQEKNQEPKPNQKQILLISACLLGVACRYDGQSRPIPDISLLMQRYQFIPVCPEILGGLKTPRVPAERVSNCVITRTGTDVTNAYKAGSDEVLRIARQYHAKLALLRERSPACGSNQIYDGSFTGKLTTGNGVCAEKLMADGITVIGDHEWKTLLT